jgi:hypothetical protein
MQTIHEKIKKQEWPPPPFFVERDVAEISIQLVASKRPDTSNKFVRRPIKASKHDPVEPGFFSNVENPTREEIAIGTLARSLRKMVQRGSVSQADADRQLAEYRDRLRREPFAPEFRAMMMAASASQPGREETQDNGAPPPPVGGGLAEENYDPRNREDVDSSDAIQPYEPPPDEIDKAIEAGGYYWCPDGDAYFRKNLDNNTYDKINERNMLRDLDEDRFRRTKQKGESRSMAEIALKRIQITRRVDFVSNICGHQAGCHEINGIRVLCPSGFTMIEACQGDCADLMRFWKGLHGRGENEYYDEQSDFMRGWLKAARIALRDPRAEIRGQIVVLVGPVDCGKTFFQRLITKMLGGRAVDPSNVFIKKGQFNSVLWGAEHLLMGDEELLEGVIDRHPLLPTLKKIVTSDLYPFTKKFGNELSLPHAWWPTISVNCDYDSVRVIPAPEENFADKISYLKCYAPEKPFHNGSAAARKNWREKLEAQLPVFLHKMIDTFEIPEEKRASRFMITHFHHPEVIELVTSSMPFSAFGEMLLDWVKNIAAPGSWEVSGTSAEIHRMMSKDLPELHRLCKNQISTGTRLGQLAVSEKWRHYVSKDAADVWHIDADPFERRAGKKAERATYDDIHA